MEGGLEEPLKCYWEFKEKRTFLRKVNYISSGFYLLSLARSLLCQMSSICCHFIFTFINHLLNRCLPKNIHNSLDHNNAHRLNTTPSNGAFLPPSNHCRLMCLKSCSRGIGGPLELQGTGRVGPEAGVGPFFFITQMSSTHASQPMQPNKKAKENNIG